MQQEDPGEADEVLPAPGEDEVGERYLAFELGGSFFVAPLARVHSVLRPVPVTRVPGLGGPVLGAFNLRSTIVPLLDLRAALGLDAAADLAPDHRFLVLEADGQLRGLVVDQLHDVLVADEEDLVPDLDAGEGTPGRELVAGLLRRGGVVHAMLDPAEISRLLEEAALSDP